MLKRFRGSRHYSIGDPHAIRFEKAADSLTVAVLLSAAGRRSPESQAGTAAGRATLEDGTFLS